MIYFVQAASGPIKIGYTKDWERRRIALQSGNPDKLTTLLVIPGEWSDEQALHRAFAAHRVRSEWFAACPEVLAYIESRRADHVPELDRRAKRKAKDDASAREQSALIERLLRCYYDAIAHRGVAVVAIDLGVGLAHLNRLKRSGSAPHWWILDRVRKAFGEFYTPAAGPHLEARADFAQTDTREQVLETSALASGAVGHSAKDRTGRAQAQAQVVAHA